MTKRIYLQNHPVPLPGEGRGTGWGPTPQKKFGLKNNSRKSKFENNFHLNFNNFAKRKKSQEQNKTFRQLKQQCHYFDQGVLPQSVQLLNDQINELWFTSS